MSKNHDINPQQGDASFYTVEVSVRITKKPTATMRIYRGGTAVQHEYLTEGFLVGPGGSDHYPVRFVHNRTLPDARSLRPGDLIRVTQGRIRKHPGRKQAELHVKRFHRIQALPPV